MKKSLLKILAISLILSLIISFVPTGILHGTEQSQEQPSFGWGSTLSFAAIAAGTGLIFRKIWNNIYGKETQLPQKQQADLSKRIDAGASERAGKKRKGISYQELLEAYKAFAAPYSTLNPKNYSPPTVLLGMVEVKNTEEIDAERKNQNREIKNNLGTIIKNVLLSQQKSDSERLMLKEVLEPLFADDILFSHEQTTYEERKAVLWPVLVWAIENQNTPVNKKYGVKCFDLMNLILNRTGYSGYIKLTDQKPYGKLLTPEQMINYWA